MRTPYGQSPGLRKKKLKLRECRQLDPYARSPCLLVSQENQKHLCQLKANSFWM